MSERRTFLKDTRHILRNAARKAERDPQFRSRLLANAKTAIAEEFGTNIPDDHMIQIHENDKQLSHLVIPPITSISEEEREAARTGAASLAYLKQTMHDPAPPMRPSQIETLELSDSNVRRPEVLLAAARESIRRGLSFLDLSIGKNGAWHCIRYNIADANIPRHFERPPFVTAYCALALQQSDVAIAKEICAQSRNYITDTMEYPGLWRYYRHLPPDLDSTTTCSLMIGDHPWVQYGANMGRILSNRDDKGLFLTWLLAPDEPDVTAKFRIEADPVVNANVIALLGDCPETRPAQSWLKGLLDSDKINDSSKWYPDTVAVCYSIARAVAFIRPVLDHLAPSISHKIEESRNERGDFDHVLQTAQAISTLDALGELGRIDRWRQMDILLQAQFEDGGWPEILAFGDQKLMWGAVGQIGHASESVTTAFCIEALERLIRSTA